MHSYVDHNLLPGEKVLARAAVHPASAYLGSVLLFSLGVLLSLLAFGSGAAALGVVLILLAALPGALGLIGGYVRMNYSEFALTDRRVIAKEGMIRRKSFDVMLAKVEGVGVNQGLLGRGFGYGDITVTGTGGTKDPFKGIAQPFDFRSAVQRKLEELNSHN